MQIRRKLRTLAQLVKASFAGGNPPQQQHRRVVGGAEPPGGSVPAHRPAHEIDIIRDEFDGRYYRSTNPDVREAGIDPVEHYVQIGWKELRDPRPDFSTSGYLRLYLDVAIGGINPFYHYIAIGRGEGRMAVDDPGSPLLDPAVIDTMKAEFDVDFYLQANPDVLKAGIDPFKHWLRHGLKELRDPTPDFSVARYLRLYPDVAASGVNPFYHYIMFGRADGRTAEPLGVDGASDVLDTDYVISRAPHFVQNGSFPLDAETAEHIMVIVIPEHNEMSGGIYSFFSIANTAYALRHKHDYRTLVMTRPNPYDETYVKQRNFRNSEDVFRFSQITRCRKAKTVYLQIPEYATIDFVRYLDRSTLNFLKSRERLYVNILNQKTDLMPEKDRFEDLRALASELTMSVAHHAYFGQEFADRYDLPILLLPAYTDLSAYQPIPYEEKERLIIYSPDEAEYRDAVLRALKEGLPDYKLQEIRGITFDRFMDLATTSRFSITFGEGFDGYLAQPIYQGGVGFAVYNDEFFPSKDMVNLQNIFSSGDDMAKNIVARIRAMERSQDIYFDTNQRMMQIYNSLYSKTDYVHRVEALIKRKFDLYPLHLKDMVRIAGRV